MEFSIVIPVRNRPDALRRVLSGIRDAAPPAAPFEVLVVDNGSTDSTARVAEAFDARLLHEPVPNRCRARNLGAREALGRWVVFIDSDCVPRPDWLQKLERAIAACPPAERVGMVAGRILAAPAPSPVGQYIDHRKWIDQEKFLTPGRRYHSPFAATANLAVRREVYLELGGLDPALPYSGEDADLCWRFAEAGWRIRYAPEAEVIHEHRATLRGLWGQAWDYGNGQADLFAKWRVQWRARSWIEAHHYVWALKGLLKTPWRLALGCTPLERREPFYDFVANTALALGRARGGLRHKIWVI